MHIPQSLFIKGEKLYQLHLQNRSEYLSARIQYIKNRLKECPAGKLIVTHSGKYAKYYCSHGKAGDYEYIHSNEKERIKLLAQKKYLLYKLDMYIKEKRMIDVALKNYAQSCNKLMEYCSNPHIAPYLLEFNTLDFTDEQWLSIPYIPSQAHPEQLRHYAKNKQLFRSKSEGAIANALLDANIAFKYECPLVLSGITFHPDFTIRHPYSKELFYWEHLGLMDSPSYAKDSMNKIQIFINNGIIPGKNLILSFETGNFPFNPQQAEDYIKLYLLS